MFENLLRHLGSVQIIASVVIAFAMLWLKNIVNNYFKKKNLKKSAWIIARHHTDYTAWFNCLEKTIEVTEQGRVYLAIVDFSESYSSIIGNLTFIDSKNADIYCEYLSKECVVKKGFENLSFLNNEFLKFRKRVPDLKSNKSLKSGIVGQCTAIREDLLRLAKSELNLLNVVAPKPLQKIEKNNPISKLEKSIKKLESLGTK